MEPMDPARRHGASTVVGAASAVGALMMPQEEVVAVAGFISLPLTQRGSFQPAVIKGLPIFVEFDTT